MGLFHDTIETEKQDGPYFVNAVCRFNQFFTEVNSLAKLRRFYIR